MSGEINGNIMQAAIGYRVLGDAFSGVDVFGGMRYYDLEARLYLLPSLLPGRSLSGSENWVDAIAGARWKGKFNSAGRLRPMATLAPADRTLPGRPRQLWATNSSGGALVAGWRHLAADYDKNGLKIDAALSGPLLGASFRY